MRKSASLLVLLGIVWCIPAMAQETTGVILGTVKDSSGAVFRARAHHH